MIPAADIIRMLVIDESLGAEDETGDWPVFVGFLPDDTDNAICVYDTPGTKDGRVSSGESIIHPGVEVRVRGTVYPDARKRAGDIADALDNFFAGSLVVGTDTYLVQSISRTGDIQTMGVETAGDRRRFNFTINAILTGRKQ